MRITVERTSALRAGVQIGFLLIGGTGLANVASANTIHVCATCAHTSIQAAVNDALSGDSIAIAAGRYVENVTIQGKSLTLTGASAGSTTVAGAGHGPVFTLGSGTPGDPPQLITLQGLTVTGGSHLTGSGVGGGVQVRAGSYLHISDSTITENSALSGGGIGVNSPGAPATLITRCQIDHNNTGSPAPSGPGGGLEVLGGSAVQIQQSILAANLAEDGAGIYSAADSSLTITSTTFSGNTALAHHSGAGPVGGGGGGVEAYGNLDVESSYFVNNTATSEVGGGGLSLLSDASTTTSTIHNTVIAQNSAPLGGGINVIGGTLLLRDSYVVQNNAYGIFGEQVNLDTTGSTINNNVGGNVCLPGNCPSQ